MLILVAPWVAYFTSIVVWLGRGDPPVIFLVAFVTMPAFVFATVAGLRSADPAARELLASVDASRLEVLWRLRLPSALPSILATARYVFALALAAAYYGEGGNLANDGLGALGRARRQRLRTARCCGPRCWRRSCSASSGWPPSRCSSGSSLRWHVSQRTRWAPGR